MAKPIEFTAIEDELRSKEISPNKQLAIPFNGVCNESPNLQYRILKYILSVKRIFILFCVEHPLYKDFFNEPEKEN